MILANLLYTLRVLAAWWMIRQIQGGLIRRFADHPKAVWVASVVLGAELTFIADYFLFKHWM